MAETRMGSVMVIGGGIAGMQAALDLANSGYYVYLVERSSSIGGIMSQLDKTFPPMTVPCELSRRNWSRSAGISILSC
jgi:heterodisulfide reductase subunit A-like polyferredoxin